MAATSGAQTKEVSEACFDFLNMEMVDYVIRTSDQSSPPVSVSGDVSVNPNSEVFNKLERLGFRVGQRLVERYTKDKTRFQSNLDVIKFLCKDFWMDVYKKQIDNLKTNHRGVFVLQDNRFRWLTHLSSNGTSKEQAAHYVVFPCGIIRGALANLGIPCIVNADIPSLPCCTFTVKIKN